MYEGPIQDLIDELSRLPGIGPKSAQRLNAFLRYENYDTQAKVPVGVVRDESLARRITSR